LEALAGARRVPGSNDLSLVTGPAQVLEHLQHRTCHAIDVRQEGLGYHGDLHRGSTAASPSSVGEPWVSCWRRSSEHSVMGELGTGGRFCPARTEGTAPGSCAIELCGVTVAYGQFFAGCLALTPARNRLGAARRRVLRARGVRRPARSAGGRGLPVSGSLPLRRCLGPSLCSPARAAIRP